MRAVAISKSAMLLALKSGKSGNVRIDKCLLPINPGIDRPRSRLGGGVAGRCVKVSRISGRPSKDVHFRHLISGAGRRKVADAEGRVKTCYLLDRLGGIGAIRSMLRQARSVPITIAG